MKGECKNPTKADSSSYSWLHSLAETMMSNDSTQVENKAVTPITPSANPAASAICHYRLKYESDSDIETTVSRRSVNIPRRSIGRES
jgi:hypothetical protein